MQRSIACKTDWWVSTNRKLNIQGEPIKNNPLEKNAVFQPWQYGFEPNFQILYVSIHTTYSTNFILKKVVDTVPLINFKVHFFMQLHIEYAWIANQIFTAFYQQFKCFNHECQMPVAQSVFKQTALNVSAQQLQQHTIRIYCKMIQIVLSMNSWSKSFCIADKMVFYLGMLASFGVCLW